MKHIDQIVRILKEESRRWAPPAVAQLVRHKRDPYLVLIACLLSLRTKDEVTEEASQRLFKVADHPKAMMTLTPSRIEKLIYPVGFYRTKARIILTISRELVEKHKGRVPDTLEGLLAFKGVGRKTANLVLTEGFNKFGICVDTHVHRISNRLGWVRTYTPNETEMKLRQFLPKPYWKILNNLLVVYGQNLCKPVSPFCSQCRLHIYCPRIGVHSSR